MKNLVKYMKVGFVFAKGIFGFRKKQYRLGFVRDANDGIWYIDMPWPGDRHNLALVAGSNKLLDYLCDEGKSYVTVDVLPRKNQEGHEGYFVCEQVDASLFGGSTYEVHGLEGFDREIWICPVTLCVLGYYPKYLYVRKVKSLMTTVDNVKAEREAFLLTAKRNASKMLFKEEFDVDEEI